MDQQFFIRVLMPVIKIEDAGYFGKPIKNQTKFTSLKILGQHVCQSCVFPFAPISIKKNQTQYSDEMPKKKNVHLKIGCSHSSEKESYFH